MEISTYRQEESRYKSDRNNCPVSASSWQPSHNASKPNVKICGPRRRPFRGRFLSAVDIPTAERYHLWLRCLAGYTSEIFHMPTRPIVCTKCGCFTQINAHYDGSLSCPNCGHSGHTKSLKNVTVYTSSGGHRQDDTLTKVILFIMLVVSLWFAVACFQAVFFGSDTPK